eukprot:FR737337.1.p2 GENE.FR737337.1~~FR737337.1.p2  ORF type:complete len:166 (+),score=54.57 FR737337.1:630-1127(+)
MSNFIFWSYFQVLPLVECCVSISLPSDPVLAAFCRYGPPIVSNSTTDPLAYSDPWRASPSLNQPWRPPVLGLQRPSAPLLMAAFPSLLGPGKANPPPQKPGNFSGSPRNFFRKKPPPFQKTPSQNGIFKGGPNPQRKNPFRGRPKRGGRGKKFPLGKKKVGVGAS